VTPTLNKQAQHGPGTLCNQVLGLAIERGLLRAPPGQMGGGAE
jgi:hypothetical protein